MRMSWVRASPGASTLFFSCSFILLCWVIDDRRREKEQASTYTSSGYLQTKTTKTNTSCEEQHVHVRRPMRQLRRRDKSTRASRWFENLLVLLVDGVGEWGRNLSWSSIVSLGEKFCSSPRPRPTASFIFSSGACWALVLSNAKSRWEKTDRFDDVTDALDDICTGDVSRSSSMIELSKGVGGSGRVISRESA